MGMNLGTVEISESWRHQKHGIPAEKSCSLRAKPTQEETMWTSMGKVTGMGLLKPFGTHILPLCVPESRYKDIELNVCPDGFKSCFGLIFSIPHPVLLEWDYLPHAIAA